MAIQARSCEIRLEGNGTISVRRFDGRPYVVDLSRHNTEGEGTNTIFLNLISMIEDAINSSVFRSGLAWRLDIQAWGQESKSKDQEKKHGTKPD